MDRRVGAVAAGMSFRSQSGRSNAGALLRLAMTVIGSVVAPMLAIGCSSAESVRLTGYILSSKTDENDNPTDIFLFDGKEEYPIEKDSKQEQLLDLVDQKVEIEGEVSTGFSGKKSVTVERFKRLEE